MPNRAVHRILVVDDDISIRQPTTEMLIRFGYEVDDDMMAQPAGRRFTPNAMTC
jgi:hypothetical protein